jgi:plasmid stabilization system protein ParE
MKLIWSKRAIRQLDAIYKYYESAAGVARARKLVQKIYDRPKILITHPRVAQRELSLDDLPQGFRRLIEGNYKIVYAIDGDNVVIDSVFDCRRDPASLRKSILETED